MDVETVDYPEMPPPPPPTRKRVRKVVEKDDPTSAAEVVAAPTVEPTIDAEIPTSSTPPETQPKKKRERRSPKEVHSNPSCSSVAVDARLFASLGSTLKSMQRQAKADKYAAFVLA